LWTIFAAGAVEDDHVFLSFSENDIALIMSRVSGVRLVWSEM